MSLFREANTQFALFTTNSEDNAQKCFSSWPMKKKTNFPDYVKVEINAEHKVRYVIKLTGSAQFIFIAAIYWAGQASSL